MKNQPAPRIIVPDDVLEAIESHCFSEVRQEVGGFLVGTTSGSSTTVTAALPARKAQATQTSLTFTHETWDEAYQDIAAKYPDAAIVGWYHSHPGFGVFMSDYDSFIQQNFFGAPGQLGLVVDPLGGKRGWFWWDGSAVAESPQTDTRREALGGSPVDHGVPGASVGASGFALSPVAGILATILVLVLAAGSFILGQQRGRDASDQLRQMDVMSLQQDFEAQLLSFVSAPAFTAPGETETAVGLLYVQYTPTVFDVSTGAPWTDVVAQRFGTTVEALAAANGQSDVSAWQPTGPIVVPIRGWVAPPVVQTTPETPTQTASPAPSAASPTPSASPSATRSPSPTPAQTGTPVPSASGEGQTP